MKQKNKILLVLIIIVLLGGLLRFWRLADYPVSLSIDEMAIGYNAYSILKTAKDEHGQFLPLAFRSIGDYKPPVLIYLTAPAIAIFGLNEFGVRFIIALIGTLTIVFVYLLTEELTKNEMVALASSFSLAISPWHIQFSRATFEAVLASFLLIVATWLCLRGIRKNGKLFWLSSIFFALSMYAYHAERIFVPIFIGGLIIIFGKKFLKMKKPIVIATMVGFIILTPLIFLMFGPQGQTRAQITFINRDHRLAGELTDSMLDIPIMFNFWIKRYLNYLDPGFLFFRGGVYIN